VTGAEQRLVAERAQAAGATAELTDTELRVRLPAGRAATVQLPQRWDEMLDFHHALPGRARGDQRELLVASILQDAAPDRQRLQDSELRAALAAPGTLPTADDIERNVLAAVLQEHYWVRPEATGRGAPRPFAFPFHAALPVNYTHRPPRSGGYKMFRSDILLFLCWDGQDIDPGPVQALCNLMSDRDGFTLLDELLVDAALRCAGPGSVSSVDAADLLSSSQAAKVRGYLASGAFHPGGMDRFREDMLAALQMPLPRHDRIEAAILTLSLHLALYYYEVSFQLGTGLDAVTRAAAQLDPGAPPAFTGRLLFRVGTAGDRPVRRTDGCASSWRELDDQYLISLTPNIITANLVHRAWRAADSSAPTVPDPAALSHAMSHDSELATLVDVSAGTLAITYAARTPSWAGPSLAELAASPDPGVHVLRSAVHAHLRRQLHYRSRAVVNQLVKRSFGGTIIRKRGPVLFFELDEAFLFLLVKFVLTRADTDQLPLREFLAGLARYGLRPQDVTEEDHLAAALESLGMLHRYSDAGEAAYVRHIL
jgi:hypothetical protein